VPFDPNMMRRALPILLEGLRVTIELSLLAVVLAALWGIPVVAARLSPQRSLWIPAVSYIQLVRNTPVLVQMYFFYFGFAMAGLRLSGFTAGLLALVLQNAGYIAEIYRAGIAAVGDRQREAGLALGMRPSEAFRIVVFPQALRLVVAPLTNQFVVIIKDTALVSTLSVAEMTFNARLLVDRTAAAYEIFATLALLYLIVTSLVAIAMTVIERRVREAH
jgi:His/Glu/Gln/Arg/opine family amino acid ABC transporter permease subunit